MTTSPLLRTDVVGPISAVREVMIGAGFTDQSVAETFRDMAEDPTPSPWRLQVLLRRTAEPTALNTLIRLFTLGVPVVAEDAAAAVAPMSLEEWVDLGILVATESAMVANCHIRAFHTDYVCSDFSGASQGPVDFVMGVSPSGLTLAGGTLRHEVESSLDLGTGSGFLGLLLARHSRHVVATDINKRAVNYARFNAILNGLDIEVREGSFFEPVADERFDLIVSNPPFVVTPRSSHMYMHGGAAGDAVSRHIARVAPRHLNDGGHCQFLASWMVADRGDWEEKLAGWFADVGCDVWILHQPIVSPERHTLEWLPTEASAATAAADVDEWLEYFATNGITGVGTGLVTMRHNPGVSNVIAIDEAPDRASLQGGSATESGFDVRVWLATARDEDLLSAVLRIPDGVVLEQTWRPDRGRGWQAAAARIRRTTGYRHEQSLDPVATDLMQRCESGQPLKTVVADMALAMNSELTSLEAETLSVVRHLLLRGFLERVP